MVNCEQACGVACHGESTNGPIVVPYHTVPTQRTCTSTPRRARRCRRARALTLVACNFFCPTTAVYCSRAVPYYSTAVSRVSPYCSRTVATIRIRPFCRFWRFCTHQLLPAYTRKIHYKIIFYQFSLLDVWKQ